ncbi:SH3 domain-containing protein [Ruegeria pomeroyi]|nr:SH3 domain-containing protein [Ruegeria pomeroyi]
MRFVIISFAVLGFAFWELSGGADFEPRGMRPAKPERVAAKTVEKAEPLVQVEPAKLVAKVSLTPYTPEPAPVEKAILTSEEQLERLARARASLSKGLTLFDDDTETGTLTLASLTGGLRALEVEPGEPEPETALASSTTETQPFDRSAPDLREITGSRVNMRDGPGTIYPVINRLTVGHKVEVLDDSGTGWLRLRVLPEQQIGWIAASLVSKKPN